VYFPIYVDEIKMLPPTKKKQQEKGLKIEKYRTKEETVHRI
jgi:hypothetical protein